jgi:hypothetical protein
MSERPNDPRSSERPRNTSGDVNQGEGNRSADRRYREATEEFVNSPRGRDAMREAGKVDPAQQREIERAEQQAKERAKEHDPAELRNSRKPA